MSILGRFFDRQPLDPTADWAPFHPPIPSFDLPKMQFGILRFGDVVTRASFLGRPEKFQWTQPDYSELLYARGGFQIDFERGKFAYLTFFIGADKFAPDHPELQFSCPSLTGVSQPAVLSQNSDRTSVENLFGPPRSVDAGDPDETVLNYARGDVTMEFEFDDSSRRLKRWNLYPT